VIAQVGSSFSFRMRSAATDYSVTYTYTVAQEVGSMLLVEKRVQRTGSVPEDRRVMMTMWPHTLLHTIETYRSSPSWEAL
jgi:hypothetical protein